MVANNTRLMGFQEVQVDIVCIDHELATFNVLRRFVTINGVQQMLPSKMPRDSISDYVLEHLACENDELICL